MKAIVVTDRAAGTAGMTLLERPEPPAAINDVVVEVHASGFVPTELAWPSTWTDRRDRDRTPSIPGHELAGVVTALGYGTRGLSVGRRVFGLTDWHRDGTLAEYVAVEARNLAPLPGDVDFTAGGARFRGGWDPADFGVDRVAGTVRARPPPGGAERARARRGRRSRDDGDAARASVRCLRHRHRTRCRPSEGARLRRAGVRRPRQRRAGRRPRSRPGFRCHRRRHPTAVRGSGSSRGNAGVRRRTDRGAAGRWPGGRFRCRVRSCPAG